MHDSSSQHEFLKKQLITQQTSTKDENKTGFNRPWWPSGLRRHAISQLIVATEGPVDESHSRHGRIGTL